MYELLKEAVGKQVVISTEDYNHEGELVAVDGKMAKLICNESNKNSQKQVAYYINLRFVDYVEVVVEEKSTRF